MSAPRLDVPMDAAGIDRAEERRGDDEWLAAARRDPRTRSVVAEPDIEVLVDDGFRLALIEGPVPDPEAVLLGVDGEGAVFARRPEGHRAAGDVRIASVRDVGPDLPGEHLLLAVQALGLLNWHGRTRFCAACGGETVSERAGYARRCVRCDASHFPRTDPAVIMLPVARDRVLLCRRAGRTHWSALAGFVEPGESLETAVAREVAEETGLATEAVTYAGSQPWPFPGQLMVGFEAEVTPGEVRLNDELEEHRWFERDELRAAVESGEIELAAGISIGNALVAHWMRRPQLPPT